MDIFGGVLGSYTLMLRADYWLVCAQGRITSGEVQETIFIYIYTYIRILYIYILYILHRYTYVYIHMMIGWINGDYINTHKFTHIFTRYMLIIYYILFILHYTLHIIYSHKMWIYMFMYLFTHFIQWIITQLLEKWGYVMHYMEAIRGFHMKQVSQKEDSRQCMWPYKKSLERE